MKARKRWFERDHFDAAEREIRPMAARLAWCPPNVITLVGLVLAIPAALAFWAGYPKLGLLCFALSLATDLFDGPVARLQDERMTDAERAAESAKKGWAAMTAWGKTRFGEAFDPFVDKARYVPAIIPLGWDRLWQPLIAAGVAFAVLLTLLRWGRFRRRALRLMATFASRKVRAAEASDGARGSNKLGKYKVHVEAVLIFLLVLQPHDPVSIAIQHAVLAVATVGGLTSLVGHLMTLWNESKAPA